MCNEKDAKRHIELATLQEKEEDNEKASKNYLEASSIYLLQSEVQKNDQLLRKSNELYKKAHQVLGKTIEHDLSKQELAKRTLTELKQGEEKMCGKETIISTMELAEKQEKTNPEEAARNYLEAADKLLEESIKDPAKEEEYIQMANRIYLKAKELKKIKTAELSPANLVTNKNNKITFADIGGLEKLKEEIRFKIIEPFKNPEIFKYYGKAMGGGILMYGPPGCGKSLIAKATANEANATFIHVKSSDLKSKYVGETEKNIEELFKKARKAGPTIIFFDEFESLGGDRTESHSYERSAVAQLLTEMDGMDSEGQQILLLAATNEPWSIDPALRREGRFGKTLFIMPPDHEARKQVFKITLSKRPVGKIDYDKLAKLSKGFSGADIKASCEMATDIPLREGMKTGKTRDISQADLEKGIKKTESVLNQWYQKANQQVEKKNLKEAFKELVIAAKEVEKVEVV